MNAPTPLDPAQPARICISITAHERLTTLEEQVANIALFCPSALVVVHLNADLAAAIARDPVQQVLLQRLARCRGVIINPAHLPTRWAHILHAHLSNIRLVRDAGLDVDAILLMSSGDLFFRRDIEAHVAQFDAGVDQHVLEDGWHWAAQVRADPMSARVLEESGHARLRISLHEGTFYRTAIAFRLLAMLDGLVTDWDYNTAYPKEELFLPSLAQACGAKRVSRPVAHLLGLGRDDRPFLARLLAELGIAEPGGAGLLDRWVAAHGATADARAPCHIVSRVPRDPDSPLRMLLGVAGSPDGIARARWVAGRIDALDLIDFDVPGRLSQPLALSAVAASAVVAAGLLAAGEAIFAPGIADEALALSTPDQAGVGVLGAARMLTRHVRAPGGRLRLVAMGSAFSLSAVLAEAGPGPEPRVMLRQALGARMPRAVVLRCAAAAAAPAVGVWLQRRGTGMAPGARIALACGHLGDAAGVTGMVWRIPPIVYRDHADPDGGSLLDLVVELPAGGALTLEHFALV